MMKDEMLTKFFQLEREQQRVKELEGELEHDSKRKRVLQGRVDDTIVFVCDSFRKRETLRLALFSTLSSLFTA